MKRRRPLSRFKRCLAVTWKGKLCKLPRRVGVLCYVHQRVSAQTRTLKLER